MSLHLALFLDAAGCHYSGWRMPGVERPSPTDAVRYRVTVRRTV